MPEILNQFLDEKEGNHTTAYCDGAEAAGRGAGISSYSMSEISFLNAQYCRRIPVLTMTAALADTPLRECTGIIKNDAYQVLPRELNGARIVP